MTPKADLDVRELGTLLGVWAHPDDEAYLSAGIMAMAVRAGSRVACVTATRGELGTPDPDRWPFETLADIRTLEMAASLEVLGVTEHEWLDYADGSCADVPFDEAVQRIAEIMTRVQPDTVVTFGPDGMTGHPDHQAACHWTTAAFEKVAKRGARLLYATKTESFHERFRSLPTNQLVFGGAGPPRTPDHETTIACRLQEAILDLKVGALRAQASQVEILHDRMGADVYRDWVEIEWFNLAATG